MCRLATGGFGSFDRYMHGDQIGAVMGGSVSSMQEDLVRMAPGTGGSLLRFEEDIARGNGMGEVTTRGEDDSGGPGIRHVLDGLRVRL